MKLNESISKIMTHMPKFVRPTDSIMKVLDLFELNDFHHVPVIERGGKVIGIISRIDVLKYFKNIASESSGEYYTQMNNLVTQAKDVMTTNPISLEPDDTIALAADIFMTNKFHALPIVEDNQMVGILTSHDLLHYAYKNIVAQEY